ncbi:MAG: peptidoglycan-binding protein [Pseudomonadota bacterium]
MTANRVRVLSATFLVMCFGVALNMIALQTPHDPRAMSSVVVSDGATDTSADRGSSAANAADVGKKRTLLRAVQRELNRVGYGEIKEDGQDTALSRAAIMAFEFDHGLPLTARASDGLLEALLLGRQRAPGVGAGRATDEVRTVVRAVQTALTKLEFSVGRIDGRVGRRTQVAIKSFERKHGMPETGRISAPLVARLARMTNSITLSSAP